MPEWKDTVNLPRTAFPMKANLPTTEPETLARWEAMGLYGKIRAKRKGRDQVRPARRAALRQRPDPPRHGAEQDPEGSGREVAVDGRIRRAVCPGLRLPRAADRAQGGSRTGPEKARAVGRRLPPGVPRLRRPFHRRDDRRVQAPRRPRRMGPPLRDDGLPLPGGDRAGAREVRRAGARLQGQEAGALVHPLPHGAGRSGSRVRGSHIAVDLRRVPAARRTRRPISAARVPSLAGRRVSVADLDDDALDDPVEPGARLSPRLRLRRVRRGRPGRDRRRSARREGLRRRRAAVRRSARAHQGHGSGGPALPASAVRARFGRRSSATTSRWRPARASCTPRRATGPTTSTRA